MWLYSSNENPSAWLCDWRRHLCPTSESLSLVLGGVKYDEVSGVTLEPEELIFATGFSGLGNHAHGPRSELEQAMWAPWVKCNQVRHRGCGEQGRGRETRAEPRDMLVIQLTRPLPMKPQKPHPSSTYRNTAQSGRPHSLENLTSYSSHISARPKNPKPRTPRADKTRIDTSGILTRIGSRTWGGIPPQTELGRPAGLFYERSLQSAGNHEADSAHTLLRSRYLSARSSKKEIERARVSVREHETPKSRRCGTFM